MPVDCRDARQAMLLQQGDALDASQAAGLSRHVAGCESCAAAMQLETAWVAGWRARLGSEPAPTALRERVQAVVRAETSPWYERLLGSNWAPRLAMAAVVALLVCAGLVWLGRGTPALATGAAERFACHEVHADGPLPPCCTQLDLQPGDVPGPPAGGSRIPDLTAAGLALVTVARCNFGTTPVIAVTYRAPAGERFSLYITSLGAREFRLLRHDAPRGVPEWRHTVDLVATADHGSSRVDVAIWKSHADVLSWVGPAGSQFTAALDRMQTSP